MLRTKIPLFTCLAFAVAPAAQVLERGDAFAHARPHSFGLPDGRGMLAVEQHSPGAVKWFRTEPTGSPPLETAALSIPVDRVIEFAASDLPNRFLVLGWHEATASGRLIEIQLDEAPPPRPLSILRTVDLGPAFFPRVLRLSDGVLHIVGSNRIAYTLAFATHPQPLGPLVPLVDFRSTPLRGGGPYYPANWTLRPLPSGGMSYEVTKHSDGLEATPVPGGGRTFTYRDFFAEAEAAPVTRPEVRDPLTLSDSFPWMVRGPAGAFDLIDAANTVLATGTFTGALGQWHSFAPTGVALEPGAEYRLVSAGGSRSIPLTPARRFGANIAGSDWSAAPAAPALGANHVGSPTFGAMWQVTRDQPPNGYGEALSGGFSVAVMPPAHTPPVTFLDPLQQQALLSPQAVLPLTVEFTEQAPTAGIGSLLPIPDDPALAGWVIYGQMFLLTQPTPIVSQVFALAIQPGTTDGPSESARGGDRAHREWMKQLEKNLPFRSRDDALEKLLRGR